MGGCGGMSAHEQTTEKITATCPVCATKITVGGDTPRATHDGTLYYFASEDHERLFLSTPEKYLEAGDANSTPPPGAGHHH